MPRPKRVLSGGVVQSGAPGFNVYASGPLDRSGVTLNTDDGDVPRQWYAGIGNFTGTDGRVLKVFAICA